MMHSLSSRIAAAILGLLLVIGSGSSASAQELAPAPPPEKVQQLIDILQDPAVKAWLETKAVTTPAAGEEAAAESEIAAIENRMRAHAQGLVAAVPRLPFEYGKAVSVLTTEVNSGQPGKVILVLAVLLAVGYGAEWLFRQALRRAQARRNSARDPGAPSEHRLFAAIGELAPLFVFAFASIGLFLAFDWPPLFSQFVMTFLSAFIGYRLLRTLTGLVLAPLEPEADTAETRQARLVDIDVAEARFWYRNIVRIFAIFLAGYALVSLLPALGVSPDVRYLTAYIMGLGILAVAIRMVWKRPSFLATGTPIRGWTLTIALVVLWLIWVGGLIGLFWVGVYILALPKVVRGVGRAATRIAGSHQAVSLYGRLIDVVIVRGARAGVIALAVAWLAYVWRLRIDSMGGSETFERFVQGCLNGIVILLIADLLWQLSKVYIEYRLDLAAEKGNTPEEVAKRGRLRTLLPIFKNTLAVFIGLVAVLTVLSGLGVEVGPIIAGAGIFGVAIGFGAQTLVKDILAGVFFMLDDAFRVGEYIESGSYKGTVESFSLRSVRLRHHRGPIYTVPFGSLGAVQNMSRDWVVEKMTIGVTYDSDIDLARKLIKKIGLELAEDPEFKESTLQPLKMQGIDSFGDFAIVLRMKLMTKPGEQFGIKRKALVMIKKAFEDNNIKIAFPTVQIAGGDDKSVAAAASEVIRQQKLAQTAAGA